MICLNNFIFSKKGIILHNLSFVWLLKFRLTFRIVLAFQNDP